MSCAIQLKRCGIFPLVIDKDNKGGLLKYANLVENYPGFPGGIKGKELVKKFQQQFRLEKLSCLNQEVLDINYNRGLFEVITGNERYMTEYLVIASGTKPKLFADFNIDASLSNSMFYGISEIMDVKNKQIVIAGAGDLAFDYALNLGKMNQVTILNRSDMPKCIPLLYERAGKLKGFAYTENAELKQVSRSGKYKLNIKLKLKSGYTFLIADYLVFAVGREADLDFINNEFKKGIKLLRKAGRLYIIGDAANRQYRQTAIASGDGIKAAMQIYEMKRGIE